MFGSLKKMLYFCGVKSYIKKAPPFGGATKHYENIYI
jgi:hypothetical protein